MIVTMDFSYLKKFVIHQKCMPYFIYSRLVNLIRAIRVFDTERFYFKYIFVRKILKTKPVVCDPNSSYEVHLLTSQCDFWEALWCLKTFYFYSEVRPMLVLHEDGTLTKRRLGIMNHHFKNCRIVLRKEADPHMKNFLKEHRNCLKMRMSGRESFKRIKMFDFYYYANTKHILILDSDILFFKKPKTVLDLIRKREAFYMDDDMNDYTFSIEYLERRFGMPVHRHFNGGLLYTPVKAQDLGLINEFMGECIENNKFHLNEQTTRALLFSKHLPDAKMLDKAYQIANEDIDKTTVCHHFVNNGFREQNYIRGFKYLIKDSFLNKYR